MKLIAIYAIAAFVTACGVTSPVSTLPSDAGTEQESGTVYVDCDDDNPCTSDIYCALCSEVDSGQCYQPDNVPTFCAGREPGCYYVNRTTPTGQIFDCFPVAGSNPAKAGACFYGVCK